MRKGCILLVSLLLFACEAEKKELTTENERTSYSLGFTIGEEVAKGLEKTQIALDADAYGKGVREAAAGGGTVYTREEIEQTLLAFRQEKDVQDSGKLNYSLGYAVGRDIVKGLRQNAGIEVDPDAFSMGVKDRVTKTDGRMNEEEIKAAMASLKQRMIDRQQEQMKAQGPRPSIGELAMKNKEEGRRYLAENRTKTGVVELPSGLQYRITREGSGKSPSATDKVTVHYRGALLDGNEFDSSFKRGQPATFPLNRVIRGWTEGLQLMKEGAKYTFYIPSDLAYGDRPNPRIPPGSTLIFEVELLKVN